MKRIEHVQHPNVPSIPALSHATTYEDLVFVSGQVGIDCGAVNPPENFEEEVNQALDSLERILDQAGASLSTVLRTNCYLADLGDVAAFNRIYMERFAEPRPARTTIQAGLIDGLRFEIDAVAFIDSHRAFQPKGR